MNQLQVNEKEVAVSADAVEGYLLKHPDFFAERLDLLEILYIPHDRGPAVSLVTKQMELLRTTNTRQERKLKELVQIARENDALTRRLHKLTLSMFDGETLEEVVASMEYILQQHFLVDFVSLKIVSESEQPTLPELSVMPNDPGLEQFAPIFEKNRPKCGHMDESQAEFLFGENAANIGSYAVIPLWIAGIEGLLGIGSRADDRFQPTMGLLFLTQMGELVSLRLSDFF
ncbi:MAG: DUF484 family protein [Methylococcales bacterium]